MCVPLRQAALHLSAISARRGVVEAGNDLPLPAGLDCSEHLLRRHWQFGQSAAGCALIALATAAIGGQMLTSAYLWRRTDDLDWHLDHDGLIRASIRSASAEETVAASVRQHGHQQRRSGRRSIRQQWRDISS